ncbi:G-protein coupled receptor GRL101-like isoform X2 [Ruditapes philippinarum]|uniref:G-protein coupled receptor GRL101-like isoform X2 n=1 Tax=Ruditapes philippinarum TaxID=129788 RepID=UPI00295B88D3|nr:G-protein coupled receptor GRL101-like isoform X2 [Ruditapes philippinarum]
MMCIYAVDASGYMTGCRSGDHLQHCACGDSDREVILFVEDEDSESRDAAMHLAKQFFTNSENNIVKLFNFNILHRKMKFDIEYRLLEIKVERVTREQGIEETGCKFKTMARDFLKQLKFSELEKRALIVLENSIESSVVASLVLSNISEPSFSIYRVIKDFSSSLYKDNRYRFVKDIHISKWSSLFSIGFRRFPEICTEATIVPCVGKYRCSSSKQCIPFEQVCDDVIHCKNGDDERLCESECPLKCNCIGKVINCNAANISMSDFSSFTVNAISLDLSKNPKIEEIPKEKLSFPYMQRLNFSTCDIHYIHKRAFFDLKNLLSLDLSNNRIQRLPDRVFSKLRDLTYLNLDRNIKLTVISSTAFKGLKSVRSLKISGTNLKKISSLTFFDLRNLLSLDLSNNRIQRLPDRVFSKLRDLTYLNLDRNIELTKISSTAFKGLKSVRSLKISGTNLKKISSLTFSGLELDSIDISYNRIEEIEDFAFNNSLVHKINFEGNKVITFGEFIFNGVTSLRELHTPAFKFCCIRPCYLPEEYCKPLKNEFSSCEDLMRNSVLQAVLWIVGFASLFGNLSSIIYRLVFDRERLKIGYGIFVTNLAVADFLMGVYLIIIAVADSLYRNRYIFVDDQWRNSNWCITAGVLSTISSEASVLFLCLITLDRLLVIKFPFGTVRFTPMKAYVSCALCWFISIILSVIPILYTSHFQNKFYSRTGVCIALPLTRDKPPGWIYSVSIFVGLNFCTFILVAVGQISIFTELRRSTSAMKKTQLSRRRDLKVARNLILVATTDFLCWFPIGVMGILALNGFPIPSDVYAWSAVFILPINSALNPFLYTVTAIIGKKSFNPSLDEQSRTAVQKEIGTAILEYQQFSRSVRMTSELVPVGTKRSIREFLDDDSCLSVNVVAALCKQLADYLRLLHVGFIAIDQICEENIYITVCKTKVNKPIVVIDAKALLAADERALQENIRQFGSILRKLILKCEKGLK